MLKDWKKTPILFALCWLATSAYATDKVLGSVSTFLSYNGTKEICVRISPIPGVNYDISDVTEEKRLCALDFYSSDIAICPKVWSTTAAVVLYDISVGKFVGKRTKFQEKVCAGGKVAKYVAHDQPARLKFTINLRQTSAIYTPSSLLYYHFSRYFGFATKVPVAVWRDMDKNVLLNEVALSGVSLSERREILAQNHAAWSILVATIDDPGNYDRADSYGTSADLVTSDGAKIYGTMYDDDGDQYGPELNGISETWQPMEEQYEAFLQTPVVIALFTSAPLEQSIEKGLADGAAVFSAPHAQISEASASQVAFWMRDVSEILLSDFIFGQQDRMSNIDYHPYYYWTKDGKVERKRAREDKPGQGDVPTEAVLILRSIMNDNDAAGRVEFKNRTKQIGLLEKLRHFDAEIYTRLQDLNADLQAKGPIYEWLNSSLGLGTKQVGMIVRNTLLATKILQESCERGELRFDLDPAQFLKTGTVIPADQTCVGS
jgi:hypothetical protein